MYGVKSKSRKETILICAQYQNEVEKTICLKEKEQRENKLLTNVIVTMGLKTSKQ